MPRLKSFLGLMIFIILASTAWSDNPRQMSVQGNLKDAGGIPVADGDYTVTFTIYDASTGVGALWTETIPVTTIGGLFSTYIGLTNPIPDSVFNDSSRWLGMTISPDPEMAPRQKLVSYPYASNAWSLTGNGETEPGRNFLGTTDNEALEIKVANSRALRIEPDPTSFSSHNLIGGTEANSASSGVTGATIGGGGSLLYPNTVTDAYGTISGGAKNQAGDNSGTENDATYTTVGGGYSNTASGYFSAIGGGKYNTASGNSSVINGGSNNVATGGSSSIGGGLINSASDSVATVGGGFYNKAIGIGSTVGGGYGNEASGHYSAICGGFYDTASGQYSMIPGGRANKAEGVYSFAAGRNAKAINGGTFVWSDFTDADFASTGNNQFLIRASGGVGIGTNSPENPLHVYEDVDGRMGITIENPNTGSSSSEQILFNSEDGSGLGSGAFIHVFDGANATNPAHMRIGNNRPGGKIDFHTNNASRLFIANNGHVGIGTPSPGYKLHIYEDVNSIMGLTIDNPNPGSSSQERLTFQDEDGALAYIAVDDDNAVNPSLMQIVNNRPGGEIAFTNNNIVSLFIADNGSVGIGAIPPGGARMEVEQWDDVVAIFDRITSDGAIISLRQDGIVEGTISVSGSTISYNAFTGSHYGWTDEKLERGELVTLTGMNCTANDNPKSEPIYGVKRSTLANDPACLGSYLGLQESKQPASTDNPHLVMAVGNGDVWVVDEGQNIRPGDYLISSSTPGHAMKDDEAKYPVGHIVARAAEAVDWSAVTQTVGGKRHARISVLFGNFVRANTATLNGELGRQKETISQQQKELEDLKARLLKLEEKSIRAEVEK